MASEYGGKRGGYRPGAGRPKTTLKAWCPAALVAEIERMADLRGVTSEEMCGYLLQQAATNKLWPITAQEVVNVCYTDRNP